ncbi:MAG: nicotinate-nucleotide--dimethylbenzimidazole phosphoribosyltransferase [Candidatus Tokpelaia sp.]|uniref:nicotinate-nucleotide--dimethylbenzimidazole phosphoribosyltransferase n=1 Tax=Candidatus Tokpelaia sp. TaxID=2233777 RepID=UPI00123A0F0B|nr:nicotinate-nucleotide--dimethylbenzimidazole phosphoribosyltransferase [Candidatus Tokpelaia sp.]KAA6204865.1 MAG: nicotinate-nucleotide--dimethylbenzimidazole phosphoribosyltransferase [Candidatus Tokpelaia sp.]KAA6207560.1 MAG: nicotinate-nucleotide--dimethylbenzimidazole phosphoribosyltransferase [Candidatus Tokpelaia sp.]KAA6404729.1 nicotinate-nucleotide--dimethylbenzimidazole phosphoribosyltransferase [Candidatus Tokpelaia sp.]
MNTIGRPFDDFRALLQTMPEADAGQMARARARQAKLACAPGALGRLEEIAVWLCGWRGREKPLIMRPLVAVFAGNHGIARNNISPYAPETTRHMVDNFAKGGAAINQICTVNDLGLKVYDLALAYPTEDISLDAAMDERSCAATMAFGMEAIVGDTDLLCLGDMGNGSAAAAAMACLLFGGEPEAWLSPAAGIKGGFFERELEFVRRAVALHKPYCAKADAFEVLRRAGGRELAAIVGAILAARMEKIPVILDGFAVTIAAAVLYKANPRALDHCLAGHVAAEPGHRKLLELLDKKPLLDLGLHLGEGTGAALAAAIVKSAALCHAQMASFAAAEPAAEPA